MPQIPPMQPRGQPQGQPQRQPQPPPPQIDIAQLMQMYEPKELQSLGQALMSLLKVKAALQPKPSPQQQVAQPGAMQQLAMMDLMRRQRAAQAPQQPQQPGQPPGVPRRGYPS